MTEIKIGKSFDLFFKVFSNITWKSKYLWNDGMNFHFNISLSENLSACLQGPLVGRN